MTLDKIFDDHLVILAKKKLSLLTSSSSYQSLNRTEHLYTNNNILQTREFGPHFSSITSQISQI